MKKTLIPTLAFLLILVLSACGGQATQTQPEPAGATQVNQAVDQTSSATEAPTAQTVAQPATQTTSEVSFANDVMPILENRCNKCHGIEQVKKGLDMTTYEGLMLGSNNGAVIEPGNAAESFLVEQINKGKMPKRTSKLSPEEIQLITDWVNAGAINN